MFTSSLPVWATFALAAAATPLTWHPRRATNSTGNGTMAMSWQDVIPSTELNWTPCFENFTCANLIVPLDYEDEAAGQTIVAFASSPTNSSDAEDILFNPGGPGGSGIDWIVSGGAEELRHLLGPKYNIVSFDPRGVNNSGINLDCFPQNPTAREYYESESDLVINGNDASIAKLFADAGGWGKLCSNTHESDNAKYANTVAVVNDMLHYTKLRAKDRGEDPEEAKMNYYGVSYGTIIGTTFASLYPDKVGRFILDGVADNVQWFEGTWKDWPLETDGAVDYFFETCYDGKDACVFYKNDESADAIKDRFDAILADIKENPISYYHPAHVELPLTITVGQVKGKIVDVMYNAVRLFENLALIMHDLESRNATSFVLDQQLGFAPGSSCSNTAFSTYSPNSAFALITCNDAAGRNILSLDEYTDLVDYEVSISTYGGEAFASQNAVSCRAYDVRPPSSQVFAGLQNLDDGATETATPILFVRNMFDPVTPAAEKMSKYFEGSVVLTQKAVGHGMNVAESECVRGYVYEYLGSGELPQEGTECGVQTVPFKTDEVAKRRMEGRRVLKRRA